MITLSGERKYLSAAERVGFEIAMVGQPSDIYLFCRTLLETGCRISEALNLRRQQLDFSTKRIYFESLKKRRKGVYRGVPISPRLADMLSAWCGEAWHPDIGRNECLGAADRLWTWSRMTGYRYVCAVMKAARIEGPQASPKGLRHGFAVAALEAGVPMHLVQRWLGHSHWETTAIYADLVGDEERAYASRIWTGAGKVAAAGPGEIMLTSPGLDIDPVGLGVSRKFMSQ